MTITLSGTPDTNITTTTTYPYIITTENNGNGCGESTISGTIVIEPRHFIQISNTSVGDPNQSVCSGSSIASITFDLDGGAYDADISWSGGNNPQLTFTTSGTSVILSGIANSGTSTTTQQYTYTITTSGNSCRTDSISGTIIVYPEITYDVISSTLLYQTADDLICSGDEIVPITFTIQGATTFGLDVSLEWTSSNSLPNVNVSRINSTTWQISGSTTTDQPIIESTLFYYNVIIESPFTCQESKTFNGIIQVASRPVVNQNFIQNNDVIDVTCFGGNDGSIIIPVSPTIEFEKRISGGQLAVQQIDNITLTASASLNAGDTIQINIDGNTFIATVPAGASTSTILQELADKINFGSNSSNVDVTANVLSGASPPVLQIISDTPGISFTISNLNVTSNVTSTLVLENLVENKNLNYEYLWKDIGGNEIGTGPSLEDLSTGTYTLEVTINGCDAVESYEFFVAEPEISIGTISETCSGDISFDITYKLTPTQLLNGETIRAELYEQAADGSYSIIFDSDVYLTNTIQGVFPVRFFGLSEGQTYQLVVTDDTCQNRIIELIGPINKFLEIDESQISVTHEQCYGEGGSIELSNIAIVGGSGNYIYEWTNTTLGTSVNNTRNLVNVEPGLYMLTVTDADNSNCSVSLFNAIEIEPAGNLIEAAWSTASDGQQNECIDGREGRLEVVVTGGQNNFEYSWEFTPSSTSQTISINKNSPILIPNDDIPNQNLSSTGIYRVLIYELGRQDCQVVFNDTIEITGPSLLEMVSNPTSTNINCAGEETGSISFEVTGGQPPYFYSITGGTPSNQVNNGSETISNLAAGTYNLIIVDSSPANCSTLNRIERAITISEPTGGPLELSENDVNPIPCEGGNGSIIIGVTGGAAEVVSGTVNPDTEYQVSVIGPGQNYRLNTSHIRSDSSFRIENLTLVGDYNVTVTDANGCQQTITVTLENSAPDNLGATAVIDAAPGCSDINSNLAEGATIRLTRFDKGDGEVSGYPLWQKRVSLSLDEFTITLAGTISTTIDYSNVSVNIDGIIIDASSTISVTTIQDLASIFSSKINNLAGYTATLLGNSVKVRSQIIDSASAVSSTIDPIRLSVSNITKVSVNSWTDVPGLAGLEVVENLQAGFYRAILRDGSGCGGTLVENLTQGGTIFRIDDPQSLQLDDIEFDEITCDDTTTTLTFKLSNGVYDIVPDTSIYELTLNSITLTNSAGGISGLTQGNSTSSSTTNTPTSTNTTGNNYSINLNTNKYIIPNLPFNDYELTIRNLQTDCIAVLNFTVEPPSNISYSGETNFILDPCYDSYQDIFFDNALLTGGVPFTTQEGEAYYFLKWTYYPENGSNAQTINTLSNNIIFNPLPGRYELLVTDKNGCTPKDDSGNEVMFEFIFREELSNLVVLGNVNGTSSFSQPVTCSGGGNDGIISIEIESSDPDVELSPYEISWERLSSENIVTQQKILFEGSTSGVTSEVYSIKINDIIFTYETTVSLEPKKSIAEELAAIINASPLFTANVPVDPSGRIEIIIQSNGSNIDLEILSKSTTVLMINSSTNPANWVPLDGTNDTTNYNGYLSLTGLSEGSYRYTITPVNIANCENSSITDSIRGVIVVENDNILEIREGPLVDSFLCNGQPGTIFIDVFDGGTGPLSFVYNGSPVNYDQIGQNQYELLIDNPVDNASLEIYNVNDCNITREINIGNGTPLFDFTSINYQQAGSYVAREEITFRDLSEENYDSFEFIFGDGTSSGIFFKDSPESVTHEYGISGTYFVTLRIYNELGCIEELTKPLIVGKGYSIQVPNVFTPNGDGKNDTFKPKFNGLGSIELSVYDYRGNLIYKELNPDDGSTIDPANYSQPLELIGWDGTNSLDSPYYIYTIKGITLFDNINIERTGTFILIR
ncbi:MAG: gliding motility-associated C-terminal domain-containing protein [Flavobacteriaceae bacterium]